MVVSAQQIKRSMPDAVWVRIFQLIQDADFTDWMYFNDVAQTQANLHGLRLVCKEFDDVTRLLYPDVTRLLYLPRSLSSQSLGSLLKWLRINTPSIRGLRSDCLKSYFQEVLSELQSIALVTTVSIDRCVATKVLLLSRLTGLVHCMLFRNQLDGWT